MNNVYIDPQGNRWQQVNFSYPMPLTATLSAGATLSRTIGIEANSDFVCTKMSYFADIAGAAQTDATRVLPLVRVSIQDTGISDSLESEPVPINCIAGHDGLPMVLAVPRIFKAKTAIKATYENFSAATDYENMQIVLLGYKMYFLGQS